MRISKNIRMYNIKVNIEFSRCLTSNNFMILRMIVIYFLPRKSQCPMVRFSRSIMLSPINDHRTCLFFSGQLSILLALHNILATICQKAYSKQLRLVTIMPIARRCLLKIANYLTFINLMLLFQSIEAVLFRRMLEQISNILTATNLTK